MPAASAPFPEDLTSPSPRDETVSTLMSLVVVCGPASTDQRGLERKGFYSSRLALRELNDSIHLHHWQGIRRTATEVTHAPSYRVPQGSSNSDFQSSSAHGIGSGTWSAGTGDDEVRQWGVDLRGAAQGVSRARARYQTLTRVDRVRLRFHH